MNPLSIRVSENNKNFLERMADLGKTKTEIVNDALDFLRKAQLQDELTAMATDDADMDASLANESMEDCLTLLDHAA
jgi:hypothetical protein